MRSPNVCIAACVTQFVDTLLSSVPFSKSPRCLYVSTISSFELQQVKLNHVRWLELFLKCITFALLQFTNILFALHHADKIFNKHYKLSSESAIRTRASAYK